MKRVDIDYYEPGKFYLYVCRTGGHTLVSVFRRLDSNSSQYFIKREYVSNLPVKWNSYLYFELNEDEFITHVALANI